MKQNDKHENNDWGNASPEVIHACCQILHLMCLHKEQGFNEFQPEVFEKLESCMNTVIASKREDLIADCKPMYDIIKRECTPLILYKSPE